MSHFSLQQTEPQLNWFVERRDNSDLFDDLVEPELGEACRRRGVLRCKDLESKTWTAVREVFVPKGLQDSARGFNPGNTSKKCPALKGRQIVVIDGSFG